MNRGWIVKREALDAIEIEADKICNEQGTLLVREVSPALDEAYAECERALEAIAEKVSDSWTAEEMLTALKHDEHEARYALAALKKAKEK